VYSIDSITSTHVKEKITEAKDDLVSSYTYGELRESFLGVGAPWSDAVVKPVKSKFKHQIANKSQIPIFNDQKTKLIWNF